MNPVATPVRQVRCSVCARLGHNMTTCDQLPFRQNQAHRLYLHMWQRWLETFSATLEPRFFDDNTNDYLDYANMLIQENNRWLKNLHNFRLLKSYLKVSHLKYKHATCNYIDGLYHYLVLKKNGVLDYVIQNNSPILAELAALSITNYAHYDYLLESIPHTSVINIFNTRQYGIVVEKKEIEDTAGEKSCDICYEDYACSNFVKTNCEHSFCQTCVTNTIKILPTNKKLSCAMCRSHITHLSCYTSENNTNLKNILNISTF
jgi:hypothetical protein